MHDHQISASVDRATATERQMLRYIPHYRFHQTRAMRLLFEAIDKHSVYALRPAPAFLLELWNRDEGATSLDWLSNREGTPKEKKRLGKIRGRARVQME